MIRLLQKNSAATKALFGIVIGLAILAMIVTLIPGLYESVTMTGSDVYATVHRPGVAGRLFGDTITIRQPEIAQLTQTMMQRSGYPPMYQPFIEMQVKQMRIQWAVENQEADRLGLTATDADVKATLHQGQLGQVLFPNGNFIGEDKYKQLVQNAFNLPTTAAFEEQLRQDITRSRLREFVTAGVTVSDNAVREAYKQQGTKVKLDYVVISPDDVKGDISATDSELKNYFDHNQARYAQAVPETRKIAYVVVTPDSLPGGRPQISEADLQAYYNQHQDQYKVEDQVKVRHILISVPTGADAKTDAAAKAKAEDILKKIKAGGDFAELAKQNSDDPGSKATGGELGWVKKDGHMVPEFEAAAMGLAKGQVSGLVKTQFGYHILQAEDRQNAHTKSLAEVKDEIRPIVEQQKVGAAEQQLAQSIANEAGKGGLNAAASAHHLQAQTTDFIASNGVVNGVADSTQLLNAAFAARKGDAPKTVGTGDGIAVYQVLDVQAAHAPAFEQWKDHVADDYKQEQVPMMMEQRLTKLSDLARKYSDLKKAATELKMKVQSSDLVGRDGNVPELGVMSQGPSVAFSLPKGGISAPINTGRNGAVLQVTDKVEPTPEEIAQNFPKQRDQLLERKRDEVYGAYMSTVMQNYQKKGGIRIYEKQSGKKGPLGF